MTSATYKPYKPLTERFRRYSAPPDEKGCVLWLGGRHGQGYGLLKINGRMERAHRVAWEMVNGPIPDGMLVCHHCDTPACVNVDHFFLGTQVENMQDAVQKGRVPLIQKQALKAP